MTLFAKIAGAPGVQAAACWTTAQYVRLVHATGRWRTLRGEIPAGFWARNKPFIVAFWHGRLLMMPYSWPRGRTMNMLISQHNDGELISRTIAHFGLATVRGSTGRGGAGALRTLVRLLAQGDCAGVTPDGPHGPQRKASVGIISLARLSGVPIIPLSYGVSRRRVLPSWDRFVLPAPFARGVFVWGEPIAVARNADADARDRARQAVEDSLNRLTDEADRMCNGAGEGGAGTARVEKEDAAPHTGTGAGGTTRRDDAPDARA